MPQIPTTQKPTHLPIPHPAKTSSTTSRWQAVVTRNPSALFVYGVVTTKIYCRPSCSARLARRANVSSYDTPAQAERAGFRACKRCKPETLKPVVDPRVGMVTRACRSIEGAVLEGRGMGTGEGVSVSARSKPTLGKLAGDAGLTPSHFHRVFKKVMGVTPGAYAAGLLKGAHADAASNIGGRPLETEPLKDEDGVIVVFQSWDEKQCADLDAWLLDGLGWDADPCPGGGGDFGADIDTGLLWNEFDVLIAAEAEYGSRQDVPSLTGGPGLSDLESSGHVV